ncbi:MAG: PDZ domain-containing protein, partial [Rhodospirillales bacterium]|nr:PDZ domain-containing protein [Rhodospirillales bacterium]
GGLVWPWFGATGHSVSQDIANALGLERPTGVLITAVHKASAAAKAGIAVGDVVLAVNGHEVNDTIGLRHRIATLPIGDSAVVRLWRGGKTRAVPLELMAAPDKPRKNETKMDGSQPLSGAIVGNMSPALAERTGIDPFVTGVFIFNIIRGSPANRLGFRAGDYLRLVNNRPVPSVKDLIREMEKPADQWRIAVLRNGRTRELIINR